MDIELLNQLDVDVSHEVSSVSFRYYSPEEIEALSVCRITRERAFDDLGRPVKRGLYDPALGITSFTDGACKTCCMSYSACPGHFGHIELPFPLVNPMVIQTVVRLLRCFCWSCGSLNHSRRTRRILLTILRFEDAQMFDCVAAAQRYSSTDAADSTALERDMFVSSMNEFVDTLPACIKKHLEGADISDLDETDSAFVTAAKEAWEAAAKSGHLTAAPSKRWRTLLKEFITKPPKKCPSCSAPSIKLRSGKAGRICKIGKNKSETVLFPNEIYSLMRNLWNSDSELFSLLYGQQGRLKEGPLDSLDHHVFFVRNVAVPPTRFRPSAKVGTMESASEHPQNLCFSNILEGISTLAEIKSKNDIDHNVDSDQSGDEAHITMEIDSGILDTSSQEDNDARRKSKAKQNTSSRQRTSGAQGSERSILGAITLIQEGLSYLYDNEPSKQIPMMGVRQQLEAKQGLFRMHMMGKRVNFSCRSVIGPDVFLATNEVGIPESFAKQLSVPEFVNAHNVSELRNAVLNGPEKHPGALAIEQWTDSGLHRTTMLKSSTKSRQGNLESQAQLLMPSNSRRKNASVAGAHDSRIGPELEELNAKGAATLPRRVMRHLKTGDVVLFNRQPTLHRVSIMAHKVRVLPGDRTIRFHYANCGSYNADFDGDEMNVHILQDPIARAEAEELMLSSRHYIVPTSGAPIRGLIQDHIAAASLLSSRDTFLDREIFCQLLFSATEGILMDSAHAKGRYCIPTPAIIKPQPLWTGKQLISAVIDIICDGRPGLNLETKSKTNSSIIGNEETLVLFRNGELLRGTLDKGSIGATIYGAVHGIQELYGTDASDNFLSAFGKLGTFFLRRHGHTTGIEDLILEDEAEKQRSSILNQSLSEVAISATKEVCKALGADIDVTRTMTLEEARSLTEQMVRRHGVQAEDRLDTAMKTGLNAVSSKVTNFCLPHGLKRSFPKNGFALMTNTGAKGGAVNSAQISCLVGSTVLEGKRVPRIGGSGATLPCFTPYDAAPNAGGFIAGRFLTGIAPFEFFFHAMAGREGLLDTSLKTANSGYLQRCLVKAMEGVKMNYDCTVRDSDDSIVQFIYGDDGLDPCKSSWLSAKIDWQVDNLKALLKRSQRRHPAVADYYQARLEDMNLGNSSIQGRQSTLLEELSPGVFSKTGAVSEQFRNIIEDFLSKKPQKECQKVRSFLESRYQRCVVEPGEPVGIVAAQSIGEPSTQMTLNTFHHAGSSSAHVTMGIPRLRELLMTASKYPKTPSMALPILSSAGKDGADKISLMLNEVDLMDLLMAIEIENKHITYAEDLGGMPVVVVGLTLLLHKPDLYESTLGFSFDYILKRVENDFQEKFIEKLKWEVRLISKSVDDGNASLSAIAKAIQNNYVSFNSEGMQNSIQTPGPLTQKNKEGPPEIDINSDDEIDNEKLMDNNSNSDSDSDDSKYSSSIMENNSSGEENAAEMEEEKELPDLDKEEAELNEKRDFLKEQRNQNEKYEYEKTFFSGLGPLCEPEGSEDRESIELTWIMPVWLAGRIRLTEIFQESARSVKLVHVSNISKCFTESKDKGIKVVTEGSNLEAIFELGASLIDFDKLETNDMFGILNTYGVEALRKALIDEFFKVFEAYGIPVNMRHLMLIADYMTLHGGYRGFNRRGIEDAPSTFQKITFETSAKFLADATLFGVQDQISNPSAVVAVGGTYAGGTGGFDLLQSM